MLRNRIITSTVLLTILMPIFYFNCLPLLLLTSAVFCTTALWENTKIFRIANKYTSFCSVTIAGFLSFAIYYSLDLSCVFLFCIAIWLFCFMPALIFGLPAVGSFYDKLVAIGYITTIFGFFLAIIVLFQYSRIYLLSVMSIVWVADVGAYFFGKFFGYYRIAPSISPHKSWEGIIGAWILVIFMTVCFSSLTRFKETLPILLVSKWGWPSLLILTTLLVAVSVTGDLFESLLKRRVCIKDSSGLLPGHGGVLDRIDSLIPVLPLAAVLQLKIWY